MILDFHPRYRVRIKQLSRDYRRDDGLEPVLEQGFEIDAWVAENGRASSVNWAPNRMGKLPVYVFGENGHWCIDFDNFADALACDLRWS